MKPRMKAMLTALVTLLAPVAARTAPASERGCQAVAIDSDANFNKRFPDLPERIQRELSTRTDLDAGARVELRLQDDAAIGVFVALPDGRFASRSVARPEDVVPTLQALLLLPDEAVIPPQTPASSPPPRPQARSIRRIHESASLDGGAPSFAPTARDLGFELSVISGVRIGDGQFGYGIGGLSFIEVKSWLIGFEGRADGYRAISGSDPETALELAALVGRRIDFGSMALDISAGPGLATKGLSLGETKTVSAESRSGSASSAPPPPSSGTPPPESSSGPVPRLLLAARLGFGTHSVWRTFVGIDGGVGPSRSVDANADVRSPLIPRYTVGLALGATVGTP